MLSADKDEKEATDGSSQPSRDKTRITDRGISMEYLMREMIAFRAEIKQTNLDVTTSIESYSELIVENGKKIENMTEMVTELSIDTSNMRQENLNLEKYVCEMTDKVLVLEQSLKDNVLEIHRVPSSDKENVIELVGKVFSFIGFFDEEMVDNCYRFRSTKDSDKPAGIIVKFVRKFDKELFIQKRKEKKNLNTSDLGFMQGQSNPVYVNCQRQLDADESATT